jgi:hypothetical protein
MQRQLSLIDGCDQSQASLINGCKQSHRLAAYLKRLEAQAEELHEQEPGFNQLGLPFRFSF